MKELVRAIFGNEAAADKDIVRFYEEIDNEVKVDFKRLVYLQKQYIDFLLEEKAKHEDSSKYKTSNKLIEYSIGIKEKIDYLYKHLKI